MVRRAPRQKKGSSPSPAARKGRLVEQIVGWLYEADDVTVEQRVHLPTRHTCADAREIDFLLTVRNSVYPEVYGLYDEQGRYRGVVPDLVWYLWATGRIPAQLGRHDVDVPLPERWSNMIGGTCYPVHAVRATVEVVGLVATRIGTAQQHALAQAHHARVDRFKLGVTFGPSQPASAIQVFSNEGALRAYVEGSAAIRVTHRVKVPRIRLQLAYWPPSARVVHHVTERIRAFEAGTLADPHPFTFEDLEGYDIRTAWEPIADNYVGVPPEE